MFTMDLLPHWGLMKMDDIGIGELPSVCTLNNDEPVDWHKYTSPGLNELLGFLTR